jgi:hypothetical protein
MNAFYEHHKDRVAARRRANPGLVKQQADKYPVETAIAKADAC